MLMGLENTVLGEISQTEKDKYYMISLICGIRKIIQMNAYTIQKQIHRHKNKIVVTKGEKEGGEGQIRDMGLTGINYSIL